MIYSDGYLVVVFSRRGMVGKGYEGGDVGIILFVDLGVCLKIFGEVYIEDTCIFLYDVISWLKNRDMGLVRW